MTKAVCEEPHSFYWDSVGISATAVKMTTHGRLIKLKIILTKYNLRFIVKNIKTQTYFYKKIK